MPAPGRPRDTRAPRRPSRPPLDPYEEWGPGAARRVGSGAPVAASPPPAAPPRTARAPGNGPESPPSPAPVGIDEGARDAVSTALETVALRVRTGELEPRGFEAGMTDAAAVATALAALLVAERR